MIDPKTLFPMVKKLLPQEPDQAIIQGIQVFMQKHPDLSNQDALQALVMALKQMQTKSAQPPFQGLVNQLGAR